MRSGECEQDAHAAAHEDEDEIEARLVSPYAMCEVLYKVVDLGEKRAGIEDSAVMRGFWRMTVEDRKAEERARVLEQYDGTLKAWAKVKRAVEMSLQRTARR